MKKSLILISIIIFQGCSYNIMMKEMPLDSNDSSELKMNGFVEKLPLILRSYQLVNNDSKIKVATATMQESQVKFILNRLSSSGLFSGVARDKLTLGYDRYMSLGLSSNKIFHSHRLSNVIKAVYMYILYLPLNTLLILGIIFGDSQTYASSNIWFFPVTQFVYDYEDEYIFTFKRWDGETRQFSAKASAQLELDALAIASGGVRELEDKVRDSILSSIIKKMHQDSNFFYQMINIKPIPPIPPINIIIN